MEAVVNAYNSSERAMGWYHDLDGKMKHDADRRMTLMRLCDVLAEVFRVGTARRSCGNVGKAQIFMPVRDSSGEPRFLRTCFCASSCSQPSQISWQIHWRHPRKSAPSAVQGR
jgi:hypothetical protein